MGQAENITQQRASKLAGLMSTMAVVVAIFGTPAVGLGQGKDGAKDSRGPGGPSRFGLPSSDSAGGDRMKHRSKEFESLTSEQQEKIRIALQEVMKSPAVLEARQGIEDANEAYRSTLRTEISKQDPEVGKLLEKIIAARGARSGPEKGLGGMKGGVGEMLRRLGRDISDRLPEERREKFQTTHDAIVTSDQIAALSERLKSTASLRDKIPVSREIRSSYFAQLKTAMPDLDLTDLHHRPEGSSGKSGKGGKKRPSPDASPKG